MMDEATMITKRKDTKLRFYNRVRFKISAVLTIVVIPLLWWVAIQLANSESATIERLVIDQGRTAALAGAQAYALVLEMGIDSGDLKLEDLLDPKYEEIHYNIAVDHPRYHTKFDGYTDTHGIQLLQDKILDSSPNFIYASGMDHLGYVPTPHARYSQDPTGDPVKDAAVSRKKQKYQGAEQLNAAGFLANKLEPTLVQMYMRVPGGKTWDVAAEIRVKEQHFGAFRVGVRADQIATHQERFLQQVVFSFGFIMLSLILLTFGMVWYVLRPLETLTQAAFNFSTGAGVEELDEPIRPTSRDEIGMMATALNRVRISLRAAMVRIDLPRPMKE